MDGNIITTDSYGHTPRTDGADNLDINIDVVIVGAGFSGCAGLHKVRQLGLTAKIFDAGSDFGGVWNMNNYPGARTDSESPIYQLDYPEVWNSFTFEHRFPSQPEMKSYFSHMAKILDLRKDTIFSTKVIESKYNDASKRWLVHTDRGHHITARYVIFATGTTNKIHVPDFPGQENFKGELLYPAHWSNDIKVEGKRIAIVGQGASGVQIVQELAKKDCELTVFIRNHCTSVPMKQRKYSEAEADQMKNSYDGLFAKAKYGNESGYSYNQEPRGWYDVGSEARFQRLETLWNRGGYAFVTSSFFGPAMDKAANAELYQFWANKVRARVQDPVKREIVAPLEQPYWIFSKRPTLEIDYFEMIDRPNVNLVSVKETPIKSFTETGIVVVGNTGEDVVAMDFDIIVLATGYDSVTGSLYDTNIHDKNGLRLQDKWKDGIKTLVGTLVPDMPNAFILYGPQAPSSLANGAPFINVQVDWVGSVIEKAEKEGIQAVEPTADAVESYSKLNVDVWKSLLTAETPSWWNGANIPGKRREPLIWFGGLQTWTRLCDAALLNWSQFQVQRP